MQTKLQQLKQKREKCKAQIKEKQNELRQWTEDVGGFFMELQSKYMEVES